MNKKGVSTRKKLFWLALTVIIVVLPLLGILGSNFSSLVGKTVGDKAFQRIDIAQPGDKFFMEVRDIEGVNLMHIYFSKFGKELVVEIEELDSVSWDFEGTSYTKFKVSSEDSDKIEKITFVLKLKEEKLDSIDLDMEDVTLYLGGKKIETKFDKFDEKYFYYEATTSGLGEFVLGKLKEQEEQVKEIVSENKTVQELEETIKKENSLPLVGKAAGQKTNSETIFSKIISFFKNLFS